MSLLPISMYEREGRDPAIASSDDLADMLAQRAHALGLDQDWLGGVRADAARRLRRMQHDLANPTAARADTQAA